MGLRGVPGDLLLVWTESEVKKSPKASLWGEAALLEPSRTEGTPEHLDYRTIRAVSGRAVLKAARVGEVQKRVGTKAPGEILRNPRDSGAAKGEGTTRSQGGRGRSTREAWAEERWVSFRARQSLGGRAGNSTW